MNSYPRSYSKKGSNRGSILVICMVLVGFGTLGVAAWMSLLSSRSGQIESNFEATKRRIARANSERLAYQAIYTSLLPSDTDLGDSLELNFSANNGKATIMPYQGVPLLSTTIGSPSRNSTTPLESYSVDVSVKLSDGVGEHPATFQLRSTSPILNNYLITHFAPLYPAVGAPLLMGNIIVKGNVMFWDALSTDSQKSRAAIFKFPKSVGNSVQSAPLRDIDGNPVLASNTPYYPITTGLHNVGSQAQVVDYIGLREIISSAINPANSYEKRLENNPPELVRADVAFAKTDGPDSSPPTADEANLLAYVQANSPSTITSAFSMRNDLSSDVLIAAIHKPGMNDEMKVKIFTAQTAPGSDALTELYRNINQANLTRQLDDALLDLLERFNIQYICNGSGWVTVLLNNTDLGHVRVQNGSTVRLVGQKDAISKDKAKDLPPVVVIVDNPDDELLRQIHLVYENERPLIFAGRVTNAGASQASVTFVEASPFSSWRIVFDLQNLGLVFLTSSNGTHNVIKGGVMTNNKITVINDPVYFERDLNIGVLAPLLTRIAWVEKVIK